MLMVGGRRKVSVVKPLILKKSEQCLGGIVSELAWSQSVRDFGRKVSVDNSLIRDGLHIKMR